jgi:uncharacterized protein YprB with RNaseH-like and TPR domain
LTSLADRIRGMVVPRPVLYPGPGSRPPSPESHILNPESRDLSPLGGEWREGCFVVDRHWEPSVSHGRDQVGQLADRIHNAADEAPFFTSGAPARPPFIFLDLETTGLSGGAGTHAFLVGCGWFHEGRFVTRQFMMTRFSDERPMLETIARECARAGVLVSFNGKSFDAPLLETRYLFHRLAWFGPQLPHMDVLHPARQFWKRDDCSLLALERHLVGHRRVGDVPGIDIPGRYFQFVRTGDARPLRAVLEHNRLDLLSLAALTARLLDLAQRGAGAARDAREALALGRLFARAGLDSRAREAYSHSIAMSRAPRGAFDAVKVDGLRALALAWRQARHFEDAARCWRELLEIGGCPASIAAEAAEALAIHQEHRVRDLAAARSYAVLNLERAGQGAPSGRKAGKDWTQAVQHRLDRIDRKLARPTALPPSLALPSLPFSAAPTSGHRTSW